MKRVFGFGIIAAVVAMSACQEPYGGRQEGPTKYPGPPTGQQTSPKPAPSTGGQETDISVAQLRQKLSGTELYGCYANNASFAEYYREDGTVIDMQAGQKEVATWSVKEGSAGGATICFIYKEGPSAGQEACYPAKVTGEYLNFYSNGQVLASTKCPFPKQGG